MFPLIRQRRLRCHASIRALVQETILTPNDFLVPLFVVEGKGVKEEIVSMPNYFSYSLDMIEKEVKELWRLGLRSVLLFAKVSDHLKDNQGKEALNPEGLMQRAIKTIKNSCPDMFVMTDVALDPYSSYGHDGIIKNGLVSNDDTIRVLAQMSVSHAQAGADIIAPSDMMDGRILAIRQALEDASFFNTGIMSYAVKYASSFYGPFRDALDSAPAQNADVPSDKKTYQMDFSNRSEAISEAIQDVKEGADILMIKPSLCYLDIVRDIKNKVNTPLAVYQVSGEYAMLKAAAEKGWIDYNNAIIEQTTAAKRAGANIIASYFAKDIIKLIS